jgi:predicted ester cyclase
VSEKIKALECHFLEELNKGKEAAMAVMDETCAADLAVHSGAGRDICGLKDYKQYCSMLFSAFPDNHSTMDDVIVEGDKAVIRYTTTGTHKGEFMGISPTNKRVKLWAIEIDRISDGKFVEIWSRFDTLDLLQQLGIAPTPGKGK